MKRYVILIAIIFGVVAPSVRSQEVKKKVAVYMTGSDAESYKKVIGARLVSTITATNEYAAVERTEEFLAALSEERDYQLSGEVRDNQIVSLGRRFGVRYVVVADVTELFDDLFVASRMINVETGLVERAFDASGPAESTAQLMNLATKIANGLLGAGNTGNGITLGGHSGGRDFVETTAGLNMKMVWVEGGDFLMGGTSEQGSDVQDNEQVIRRVKLASYYIGECEVTQSQWAKVMGTSIQQQASKAGFSECKGIGPDYPLYYVSWEEAQAFCLELSRMTGRTYCLPTEAQWEYAARGGKNNDGSKYSGSWSVDAVAWYNDNSGSSTHPVKNKRANSLGLYDMSGNVWEWCSDWYNSNYNVNDTNNPTGPSSGATRVLRGGGWFSNSIGCRVSHRGINSPGYRNNFSGFRVVVLP